MNIPRVTQLGIDDGCSKAFKKKVAAAHQENEDHHAKLDEFEADQRTASTEPGELYSVGSIDMQREQTCILLSTGIRLRRNMLALFDEYTGELTALRETVNAEVEPARERVAQGLRDLGFLDPETSDEPGRYQLGWVACHPAVRGAHLRADELIGRLNDHAHPRLMKEEISQLERRLQEMRQRLATV